VLDQAIGPMMYDTERYAELGRGASHQDLPSLLHPIATAWKARVTTDRKAHILGSACGGEPQEVSPAPLRTVSGRASRYSGATDVLGFCDPHDAFMPAPARRRAPSECIGDPEERVAVRWHVVVQERIAAAT
jgi:hypothetical protein